MSRPKFNSTTKTVVAIWNDVTKVYEAWDGVLTTGDIEIGAVELKDGDSDTRADIESDGTKNALFVQANDLDIRDLTSASDDVSVTTLKPDGTNTMPSLDTVGRAGFIKLTDGAETAAVDTESRLVIRSGGMAGASTNGSTQLTGANTWVQVPTAAPASDYVLVVTKENEAGVMRWSFENGGVPGVANGNRLWSDDIIFNLKANEVVYFGSTDAGDDVNWTTKIV